MAVISVTLPAEKYQNRLGVTWRYIPYFEGLPSKENNNNYT